MTADYVRPALVLALALVASACQLPNSRYLPPQANVKLRALAADDVAAAFDPLELGLPDIHAVAALPDGGALLATEGGIWRYMANGEAKLLTSDEVRFAALVPDGKGAFLAFNRNSLVRQRPAEVSRVDAEGKATLVASFGEGRVVRAVAPGPAGSIRALILIVRRSSGADQLEGIEASVWEAQPGAEPTKLRDLSAEDAQAIGVPSDEQATGVDADGRFVLATGKRRYVGEDDIIIGIGLGPQPQAAVPVVPLPTALVVRLDPLAGGVEALEADGNRVAIDGQGNRFGLDALSGALTVREGDQEPVTLLDQLPGPSFPRGASDELAIRAALGADGVAFLAPEMGVLGSDGLRQPAYAPNATTLMRIADGAATRVMGAVGGQQAKPKPGAFDLIEPPVQGTHFMWYSAIGLDGRIALSETEYRTVRVVQPGKSIKLYTWPERHSLSALALGADGVPWIAYTDQRDVPAGFPAGLFGAKDRDTRIYLGRLLADGTIERKATLLDEKFFAANVKRLVVRANGSAFFTREETQENPVRELMYAATDGAVRKLWTVGAGRRSDQNGNYNIPGCSLGLAQDGALEIVAGTQHARVAAGSTLVEELPDLPVNGAYPAVDAAGRLHVVTAGPTLTRIGEGEEKQDVLAGLFAPSSLDYRLGTLDAAGFDGESNLYLVDRRQQRLFRVPAGKLPK